MACEQDRSGTHFSQPYVNVWFFKQVFSVSPSVFRKPVSSSCPGDSDQKDWPGHPSVSGGSVLAGTWEACQESFDLEQPLGPGAAFCWSDKEQKKGSLSVHIRWKFTKVLFDKHRDFLQCFYQKLSPFQTRGHRYDGCRDVTSIKCSVVWVPGPHKAWEWRWPWVLFDQAPYQWPENHQ